jgi:hypothetical protein
MRHSYSIVLISLLFVVNSSFANNTWRLASENPAFLHRSMKQVTDVIIEDIYSPPVASRIYAYVSIAGYEASRPANAAYRTLSGQIRHLKPVPKPDASKAYSFSLASVYALLTVGKHLVFSEEKLDAYQKRMLQEFKATGMPEEVFQNSVSFGKQVADHVLLWSTEDNYKLTRALERHLLTDDVASWKPTPPSYMKAVEPHWSKIRPFLIDSAQQFKPVPPTPFSEDKGSQFYKEAAEVYAIGKDLTAEQRDIANFWDCNPFKMNINGHLMFATKKISPGGHWINIAQLACKKANADLVQSAEAYACLSVTLADAFISCWDEKYRSNVIRPETYINQYIDESWMPLLQTPPFPEYTSGHSVVSAAAAQVLTKLFGDNFAYADSTEVEFGLPVREFKSFKHAAEEAAISRLYGGIHYMPAIKNGLQGGNELGQFVVRKLKMREEEKIN